MSDRLRKIFLRLRIVVSLLRLVRDPGQTDLVFDIADRLYSLGAFGDAKFRLESDPDSLKLIRERRLIEKMDLDQLLKCPPGSLGHAFATHMKALGFDPEFFRKREIDSDIAFIVMRLRQSHDLWHVVTGFKTDVPGEIALQAFTLAYLALPLPAILVAGSLLRAALTNDKLGEKADAVSRGTSLGLRARGLFSYDWEANWSKPLEDVRRELNLAMQDQQVSVRI